MSHDSNVLYSFYLYIYFNKIVSYNAKSTRMFVRNKNAYSLYNMHKYLKYVFMLAQVLHLIL